ncbi:MAG: AAA family ATPase [Selenomonadaceae bacterium]|nr:AAA family ATPase [Selenomonadaceae bacterium]
MPVKIEETALDYEMRKKEVEDFAEFLDERQNQINERRELLAEREQTLLKREQEIETAALQNKARLFDELQSELQETRIRELKKLDDELKTLRQKGIDELNRQFATQVEAADAKRAALVELQRELQEIRVRELKKLDDELEAQRQKGTDELQRQFATQVEAADAKRVALVELQRELQEIRVRELKKLDDELEAQRQKGIDELNQQLAAKIDAADRTRAALEQELETLREEKAQLERERKALEFDKVRLKKLEETLKNRQAAIETEIESGLDDRHKKLEVKLTAVTEQEKNLLDTLKEREAELATFQNFRAVYGDTPEVLMRKIQDLKDRNAALVEELGKRPGEELQSDFARLEGECRRLNQERVDINKQLAAMQEQFVELQTLRQENTILQASKENLKSTLDDAQETIDGLQARIARLTAAEITPADWDKRAASLREPYLTSPFNAPKLEANEVEVDEIDWLERMTSLFEGYGITFPQRILYAFHTSFKIANWSTLTVLAGVSGTGKSELPRLYSAFGGFNFITVPVQPNWDSQESMLGFFNSIDNKFDAQPVLRFLVECTEKYENNMAIVLLDEMNLAHVEHYFADFLSKLETRRSSPEGSVPEIYVNLGAGVKPYGLPLKRNILWCGTMNQDETTKSLSDKVLDRGIVINFPRPRELKSRKGSRPLEIFCENKGIVPMNIQLWNSWREKSIKLQGDQLNELENYRHLLESMNEHLSHAGRAIGHRVWQSIEHYVINYPTVRAAIRTAGGDLTDELRRTMHTAVEDQIVQKVMPKLRGIETRGNSYEKCLLPIKGLLNDRGFNLNDDFERACSMGYGQFMWNSAEYIGNDDAAQENSQ